MEDSPPQQEQAECCQWEHCWPSRLPLWMCWYTPAASAASPLLAHRLVTDEKPGSSVRVEKPGWPSQNENRVSNGIYKNADGQYDKELQSVYLSHTVGKQEAHIVAHLSNEWQCLLVVFLCFTTEAWDEVTAETHLWHTHTHTRKCTRKTYIICGEKLRKQI